MHLSEKQKKAAKGKVNNKILSKNFASLLSMDSNDCMHKITLGNWVSVSDVGHALIIINKHLSNLRRSSYRKNVMKNVDKETISNLYRVCLNLKEELEFMLNDYNNQRKRLDQLMKFDKED